METIKELPLEGERGLAAQLGRLEGLIQGLRQGGHRSLELVTDPDWEYVQAQFREKVEHIEYLPNGDMFERSVVVAIKCEGGCFRVLAVLFCKDNGEYSGVTIRGGGNHDWSLWEVGNVLDGADRVVQEYLYSSLFPSFAPWDPNKKLSSLLPIRKPTASKMLVQMNTWKAGIQFWKAGIQFWNWSMYKDGQEILFSRDWSGSPVECQAEAKSFAKLLGANLSLGPIERGNNPK